MPIEATRALLDAALSGLLDDVEYRIDPVFGLEVPVAVPGVDSALLDPRSTWADPAAYDAKAGELARRCSARTSRRFRPTPATRSPPAAHPPSRSRSGPLQHHLLARRR